MEGRFCLGPQPELLGGAAPGVQPPQVHGELARHGRGGGRDKWGMADGREMAFLRAAPVAFAPLARSAIRFRTGGYCGWNAWRDSAYA